MIEPGSELPEWQVETLDGAPPPSFLSFNGSPMVLLFYSVGCPGCKARALPFARELSKRWPGGQVIGIHTRFEGPEYSAKQVQEINQVYQVGFPVYLDKDHATFDLYQAEGTPHWLLIDKEGRLLKSMFGSMPNTLQRLDLSVEELEE